MDPIFEKALIKVKLDRLFSDYGEKQAKQILIKCVSQDLLKKKSPDTTPKKIIENIKDTSICTACNSSNFEITNSQEICRDCGIVHRIIFNSSVNKIKNDEQFIKITDNKFKTKIDGKEVTLDIDKLNLYSMDSLTPHQRLYRNGEKNIKTKLDEAGIEYTKDIMNSILKMYWNITLYYDKFKNVKPSIKTSINKNSYQALCVYYGFEQKYNVYKILEVFDVTLYNVEYFNSILKVIFKGTDYDSILNDTISPQPKFIISNQIVTEKTNKLMRILIDEKLFKEETKETYGATALYVARDILKMSYTGKQIQTELNITNLTKFTQSYNKVKNFISANKLIIYTI
jgi:hypothetical protein